MFTAMLAVHLKWSRLALAVSTVAAFALPLLTIQGIAETEPGRWDVNAMLDIVRGMSALYPMLAGALGLVFGVMAWNPDHRGNHVYALSLPLPRWHYVLLKFAAGALFVLIPAAALWIGALVASVAASVPTGLQAYPHTVALRFLLASLVAYGFFFSISSATTRTAAYVLSILAALVVAQVALATGDSGVDILSPIWYRLVNLPGPFEVFTGRWMLIDV